MKWAVALLVIVAFSGCVKSESTEIGQAALELTKEIVYLPDGSLRHRAPEQEMHGETAVFLASKFNENLRVEFINGTGAEYQLASKHPAVEQYLNSCPQSDKQELPGFQFSNIHAWSPAEGKPRLFLMAHWDAKEHGRDGQRIPAANDGAAGVALAITILNTFDVSKFPFELHVLLVDGEDGFEDCHPIAGSTIAAGKLDLTHDDRAILLDMIGDPESKFIRESYSLSSDKPLVEILFKHGSKIAPDRFTTIERQIADDHLAFIHMGARAIDLIDAGRSSTFPPYWHTVGDDMSNLSAKALQEVAQALQETFLDPALKSSW